MEGLEKRELSVKVLVNKIIEEHCSLGRQALSSRCIKESTRELDLPYDFVKVVYGFIENYIDANFPLSPNGRCIPGRLKYEGHSQKLEEYVLSRFSSSVQAS